METQCQNIYANVPKQLPEELVGQLIANEKFILERIVSKGHATPPGQWYDQAWDEWVFLLQGQAKLLFAENAKTILMKPGDYLIIPAHVKHRVEWTPPDIDTFWLTLHFNTEKGLN